eukprot:521093_1
MFNKFICRIIFQVKQVLNEPNANNCKFIALVGGFSSSKYFKFRIKEAFGPTSNYKLIVKTLKKPSLCVVTGAAYFGGCYENKKDFIQARILKYTYGIEVAVKLKKAHNSGL